MAHELRSLRRQKVRYNDDNDDFPLKWSLVVDGEKFTAAASDACTIAVYKPGSTTAVLDATAATVTAGSSLITYALDTTTVADFPVDEGYRAEIVFTDDSASLDYDGHFIFDVVRYPLRWMLTRDQLVDRDWQVNGMSWAGDDSFAGVIEMARDDCQLFLESLSHETGPVLEDMALDHSKLSAVWAYYALDRIFRTNGDDTRADYYERLFRELREQFVAQMRLDISQSGQEDTSPTQRRRVRLTT